MPRRKKVRTTISLLRRPKKCLRRASHFLEFFRFFRGNMIRLRLIPAHLRCQKDAGFLAARKCMCGFVSLQLFSSHLNQSEPHSNHVNRRKTRTSAPNCPSSSTTKRTCLLLCRIKWLLVPRPARAERLSPSLRQNTKAKDRKAKARPVNAVRHVFLLDSQIRSLETAIRPTGWIYI